MPDFKPAYLIHGDDHGRIGERRAALRALAERESGSNGVECFEGDAAAPDVVAGALAAMTVAIGRRFLIVDGAERWKDADIARTCCPRSRASARRRRSRSSPARRAATRSARQLAKAVERAGGSVAKERTLKAKELPSGCRARPGLGVGSTATRRRRSSGTSAIASSGCCASSRSSRWSSGPGPASASRRSSGAAAHSAEHQVWGLVDTLVAGDEAATTRAYLELAAQGESVTRLVGAAGAPRARGAGDRPRLEAGRPGRSRPG